MTRSEILIFVEEFLTDIGLNVQRLSGASGFVPGIEIAQGALRIDPGVCHPGDLLHEAGHLAVIPSAFRHHAATDLGVVFKEMGKYITKSRSDVLANELTCRAILQAGECEATAWAWAAGVHLGLPPRTIIQPNAYLDEFGNTGAAGIRSALSRNAYFGINGLQTTGWCAVRGGNYAEMLGLPVYPKLAFWLQR